MMLSINIAVVGLLIMQDLFLWICTHYRFIDHSKGYRAIEYPNISILVPARNEETFLPACLKSLEELDYPHDKIQFIIGNDQSSDLTPHIIRKWVSGGSNRVFVDVEPGNIREINGKANALSQMAEVSSGDFFFFTDADCVVNPFWVKELISAFDPEAGLVTGITAVRTTSFFSWMQGIDWWITLGMVKVTSDLGSRVTSMGNNMMLSKQAYLAVGGFRQIDNSVTEDLAMAQALIKKRYLPVHQVSAQSLVYTKPERSVLHLLKQRKRWMSGALSLPWYWLLILSLQFGFFPAILGVFFVYPGFALGIWLLKILLQSFLIRDFAAKTAGKIPFLYLLSFELYYLMISWSTIVYYFWPSAINWKERKYTWIL